MVIFTYKWAWHTVADSFRFWASGGEKFTKMGDCLPWMLTNYRANFDAASFILDQEIRNHTNTQTNCNRYIHTLPIGICG